MAEVYDRLRLEPFWRSDDEIVEMTDRQIASLFAAAERASGGAGGGAGRPGPVRHPQTVEEQKALFMRLGRLCQVPAEEMERRWAEQTRGRAGRG